MKKTLIALAAVAVSSAAFAQSSVTIDGFVTLGVENADSLAVSAGPTTANPTAAPVGTVVKTNGTSRLNAANGANQLRFRGTEDLGGGLKAHFTLAQRFSPESGSNDGTLNQRPTFQGESTVGLSGGFGGIKLGRALTALQGPVNATDPWGTWTVGSTAFLPANYVTDKNQLDGAGLGRTDGIFYNSPNFGGFTVAASLGLKAAAAPVIAAGGPNAKNLVSLWGSYANGPLMVGAGYEQNRQDDDITAILATYDFGAFKLGGGYGQVDLVNGSESKNFNLMGAIPFGAVTLKAGYGQVKLETPTAIDPKTTKVALGAEYRLSKRTYMYTTVARTKVSTVVNSRSASGFDLGMSHSF
ncbi:MAG: porin [Hydrogenophaga sp.]|uniref:porin n=1 Tax=Hydrogenophaga sp. TaxID=1904254 RepID=UPI002724B939|nr:porin [Hydrogenophaga sp.]MDO9149615.1 porin [Hydrogenophaga sp.]MDO9606114.1 porin [Hydrogenophaga sp.]